jgi:hypothetical protein
MTAANTKAVEEHPTPPPKIPETGIVAPHGDKQESKIDQQMKESFPASDPPSFSGGNHTIGAPKGRESESPGADAHEVVEAEKKVKTGDAAKPETY